MRLMRARVLASLLMLLSAANAVRAAYPEHRIDWNRELVEVADLSSLSLSPDGAHLLFRSERPNVSDNRVHLFWYLIDTRSGMIKPIGGAGDAIVDDPGLVREEAPLWLADGSAIVRGLHAGAVGLWRLAVGDAAFKPWHESPSDIEQVRLSIDGRWVEYRVGPTRAEIVAAEDRERADGIRIDRSIDLGQALVRGGSINGRPATQRLVGYWYVRAGLLQDQPRQWRRRSILSARDEPFGTPAVPAPFQPPSPSMTASADGKSVNASWSEGRGAVTAVIGGRRIECSHAECRKRRVVALAWRRDTDEVILTLADTHHRQWLVRWNPADDRWKPLTTPEGLVGGSRRGSSGCAVGTNSAYCVAASAASPPRIVRIELESGRQAPVFDPNAELRAAYRPVVEPLEWTIPGGVAVTGYLLLPRRISATPRPLFLNYYRCEGFLRGGEGDDWPMAALLDAGFAVGCINAAPLHGPQNGIANYQAGLEAVKALRTILTARKIIDPSRIAMGGLSFGSEVALWTAMKSNLLAAVSIASAQLEPTSYWYGSIQGPLHSKMTRDVWDIGKPEETPARWNEVAPSFNVAAIRAPVLLQLPEQEARHIPELFVRLSQSRTPVEFWAYPDEAHIKAEPRHRLAVYQRNLDWFRYWLQGYRDPVPAKIDQYRRWDAMAAAQSGSGPASPLPKP